MKILRSICLVLSKILLVITMILFICSLSIGFILENGISQIFMNGLSNFNEQIQHREMSVPSEIENFDINNIDTQKIYNEVLDKIGITEEQLTTILESDFANDLFGDFINTIFADVTTGDQSDFDAGEKVLEFVEENKEEIEQIIEQPLPMEKIEEFAQSEEVNQFNEEYKNVINNVSKEVPQDIKNKIKIVETVISKTFRNYCLGIIVGLLFVIALLQWSLYKWVRTLGNTMIGVGIFMVIINVLGDQFSSSITELLHINGDLSFGRAIVSSSVFTGVGFGVLIIYLIIKKIIDRKDEKNEISENVR